MKLEIKHLCPYLPYALRASYTQPAYLNEPNIIGEIIKIVKYEKKVGVQLCSDVNNQVFIQGGQYVGEEVFIHSIKPILRPLSDLTKEIEIDGEKFIPSEWIKKNMPNVPNWNHMIELNHVLEYHSKKGSISHSIIEYVVMIKFIAWHFDVFGLIPEGLAIDLNTIEK